MKVLAVTNLFPNAAEPGRATFNRQHFSHLSELVDLELIAPVAWTSAAATLASDRRALKPQPGKIRRAEHPRFFYPPKVMRGSYHHFYRWSIRRSFSRCVAGFRPDVVYATWIYPDGLAALDLAKGLGLPVVLKAHGSDIHSISGSARTEQTRKTLSEADGLIAVSNDLKNQMIALGAEGSEIRTVYNGVELSVFRSGNKVDSRKQLGIDPDRRFLLFVGNLKPVKGIDRLIHAFAKTQSPELRLVVLGGGSEKLRLEELAGHLGVGNRIEFLGPQPHDKIPRWMRAADALCLFSRNEGLPNVVLEALAAGTPVITTAVGGIPEVVIADKNGFLIDPEDALGAGQTIDRVVAKTWDSGSISESVARFSWATNAAETARILSEVRSSAYEDARAR